LLGNCLIINSYSYRNAGDAAIMLATDRLLTDSGADKVILSSRYDDVLAYRRHGVSVIPEVIPFPIRGDGSGLMRTLSLARSLAMAIVVIAVGEMSKKAAMMLMSVLAPRSFRVLRGVDTLVIAGGGYMYSSRRTVNMSLWHSLLSIRFAQVAAKRTVMMPQSVGPVSTRLDATLIEWALDRTSVVVRERRSLYASRVPLQLDSSRLVDDIAFYGAFGSQATIEERSGVRVVVMDWRWSNSSDPGAFQDYIAQVALVIDGLIESGFPVVIGGHSSLPEHDQDDIEVARMVQAACASSAVEIDEDTDVRHLEETYARCALVIGTRLHACIMAVAVGTPAISLAYQEKSAGVLENVGLADHAFLVSDFRASDVLALAKKELSDARPRHALATRIRERIVAAYREDLS
jgi:polysaccharide pyruvyl transferase WcaK-like protein